MAQQRGLVVASGEPAEAGAVESGGLGLVAADHIPHPAPADVGDSMKSVRLALRLPEHLVQRMD